jgi:hypothetical protein
MTTNNITIIGFLWTGILVLFLCLLFILGVYFVGISITAQRDNNKSVIPKMVPDHKIRVTSEKVPYYENTCLDYVDYALPAGRLEIQPNLATVFFNNTWGYTLPASRIEDIEIWVHEFVEATLAWILHKTFGHHDFVLPVVNRNIKYQHSVVHLITSLFHVSYMSNGYKRLSPDEYEDIMFGHDDNDKEGN